MACGLFRSGDMGEGEIAVVSLLIVMLVLILGFWAILHHLFNKQECTQVNLWGREKGEGVFTFFTYALVTLITWQRVHICTRDADNMAEGAARDQRLRLKARERQSCSLRSLFRPSFFFREVSTVGSHLYR